MLTGANIDDLAKKLLNLGLCFKYKVKKFGKGKRKCYLIWVDYSENFKVEFHTCSGFKDKKGNAKRIVIVSRILYIDKKGNKKIIGIWALRNLDDVKMIFDYIKEIRNEWWPIFIKPDEKMEEICFEED